MHVTACVTRRDLFLAGLSLLPKSRANRVVMALVSAGALAFFMNRHGASGIGLAVALVVAPLVGIGAVVGAFLGNMATFLWTADKDSGVLGMHEFSLAATGLAETTAVNESHYAWAGVTEVVKLRHCMLVRIKGSGIYVIPRRAFSSPAEFDTFFEQAASWWQEAHRAGGHPASRPHAADRGRP